MNMNMSVERFSRQADIVSPDQFDDLVAVVIGLGAIGRPLCGVLAATGVRRFVLCDFDRVEESNVASQGHSVAQIGRPKVEAVRDYLTAYDAGIQVEALDRRFSNEVIEFAAVPHSILAVFLCVDSLKARREIYEEMLGDAPDARIRVPGQSCRLFFCDGRVGGFGLQVLCPRSAEDWRRYAWSVDESQDSLVAPLPCGARSLMAPSSVCANLMALQLIASLRREKECLQLVPPFIRFDLMNLLPMADRQYDALPADAATASTT